MANANEGRVEREPTREDLMGSPCTSYWLKGALEGSRERDILDALGDAELLVAVLKAELESVARGVER